MFRFKNDLYAFYLFQINVIFNWIKTNWFIKICCLGTSEISFEFRKVDENGFEVHKRSEF